MSLGLKKKNLKVLRIDRGRKYLLEQFKELCEEKRIRGQLTILYTLQKNKKKMVFCIEKELYTFRYD
jgi:hypothetical protein